MQNIIRNNVPKIELITVIDAMTHKTLKHIKTGKNPKHPLVTPDGKYVLVNHTGEVKAVLLDAKTNKELKTFAVDHVNCIQAAFFLLNGCCPFIIKLIHQIL